VQEIRDLLATEGAALFTRADGALADRRLQIAAAVLMVSVIRADRNSGVDEYLVLARAIARLLDGTPEEALSVVRAAELELEKPGFLEPVIAHLVLYCTRDQKVRLVEGLWRLAYADAELQGHEEYLVRKLSGLLQLTTADLIEAKLRAREAFLGEDI
jgi:uncharacterized tellurite resistance protein B-like protein